MNRDLFPANTRRQLVEDAGPTLTQHWVNWANINPTLGQRFVFAGL